MLGFESGQNLLARGILAGFGFLGVVIEFEFIEQNLAQLLRRPDVERLARDPENLLLHLPHIDLERGREIGQCVGIEGNAFEFEVGQYLHERHFNLVE